VELDVNALQLLEERDAQTALWPCTVTCTISCDINTI
jgi:hypothetical protein